MKETWSIPIPVDSDLYSLKSDPSRESTPFTASLLLPSVVKDQRKNAIVIMCDSIDSQYCHGHHYMDYFKARDRLNYRGSSSNSFGCSGNCKYFITDLSVW